MKKCLILDTNDTKSIGMQFLCKNYGLKNCSIFAKIEGYRLTFFIKNYGLKECLILDKNEGCRLAIFSKNHGLNKC